MRQMKGLFLVLAVVLATAPLVSCAGRSAESPAYLATDEMQIALAPEAAMPAPTSAPMPAPMEKPAGGDVSADQVEVQARMMIRTGEIVGRYRAVEEAVSQVEALVAAAGGYVVNSNLWRSDEGLNANMSVKVPADRFDEMMTTLSGLAEKVERSSTYSEDVTEEYFDLDARLRALRATEEQLLLLLEDVRERMQKADDILAVYRELQDIQSQIEQYQGRQQYLDRMVAMSTINLRLLAVEAETPVISGTWEPMGTLRSALRALTDTGQFLLNALIWVAFYVVPLLALLLIPLGLILLAVRALLRRRQGRRPGATGEPPATG